MKKLTAAFALSLAVLLPFTAAPSFANEINSQADLCAEAPVKAAKANIDCAATSSFSRSKDAAAKTYPAGPAYFSNGIVF